MSVVEASGEVSNHTIEQAEQANMSIQDELAKLFIYTPIKQYGFYTVHSTQIDPNTNLPRLTSIGAEGDAPEVRVDGGDKSSFLYAGSGNRNKTYTLRQGESGLYSAYSLQSLRYWEEHPFPEYGVRITEFSGVDITNPKKLALDSLDRILGTRSVKSSSELRWADDNENSGGIDLIVHMAEEVRSIIHPRSFFGIVAAAFKKR